MVSKKVEEALAERSNINSSQHFIKSLTKKISIVIPNREFGTGRNYKFTAATRFNVFEDYSNSELKTRKLSYVLDELQHGGVSAEKLEGDKHCVGDIIIN